MSTSLKELLAERRRELKKDHPIDLPIPGYEDTLFARYHVLDFATLRKIGKRSEGAANLDEEIQSELNISIDALCNACDGVYVIGSDEPIGRWSSGLAQEYFGVEEVTTARDAVKAIFPNDLKIIEHFTEYSNAADELHVKINEEIAGESEAAPDAA